MSDFVKSFWPGAQTCDESLPDSKLPLQEIRYFSAARGRADFTWGFFSTNILTTCSLPTQLRLRDSHNHLVFEIVLSPFSDSCYARTVLFSFFIFFLFTAIIPVNASPPLNFKAAFAQQKPVGRTTASLATSSAAITPAYRLARRW